MSGFDLRQAQGLAEAKAHRQHAESFRDPLLPQHIEDTADRRRTFGYDQAPCWICLADHSRYSRFIRSEWKAIETFGDRRLRALNAHEWQAGCAVASLGSSSQHNSEKFQ